VDEEVLQDEPHRKVVRVGGTVRRPTQPWTPAVHALLRYLEDAGFFASAYGLASAAGLVEAVIDVQRDGIEQVRRLAAAGHQPQARWVTDGFLGELERKRAWSQTNRHLFG
jgi:hypothetical protein